MVIQLCFIIIIDNLGEWCKVMYNYNDTIMDGYIHEMINLH